MNILHGNIWDYHHPENIICINGTLKLVSKHYTATTMGNEEINGIQTYMPSTKGTSLQYKTYIESKFNTCPVACIRKFETSPLYYDNVSNYIVVPTKTDMCGTGNIEVITKSLHKLKNIIQRNRLKNVYITPLGCGSGGLKQEDVVPLMHSILPEDVNLVVNRPDKVHITLSINKHYYTVRELLSKYDICNMRTIPINLQQLTLRSLYARKIESKYTKLYGMLNTILPNKRLTTSTSPSTTMIGLKFINLFNIQDLVIIGKDITDDMKSICLASVIANARVYYYNSLSKQWQIVSKSSNITKDNEVLIFTNIDGIPKIRHYFSLYISNQIRNKVAKVIVEQLFKTF